MLLECTFIIFIIYSPECVYTSYDGLHCWIFACALHHKLCGYLPIGSLYSIHFFRFQLTSLELQYVSPKLLMCRDMELAVPGTYDPNQPIIKISHIQSSLQVITSKQRPRKLSIFGK
jgi:hypothetical protein